MHPVRSFIVFRHAPTMAMAVSVFDSAGLAPWAAELYLVAFSFPFQHVFPSLMLTAFALLVPLTSPPTPKCRNIRNGKQERLHQGGICHPPGYEAIRPIFSLPRDSLALDASCGRHETS